MSEIFARINLSKTNYSLYKHAELLTKPNFQQIDKIYTDYCRYKKFESVMPLFEEDITSPRSDIIGYYDNNELVAFSFYHNFDANNVEAIQFAWNYNNPKLTLGIKSLRHECAYYKAKGVDNIYLGYADEYKKALDGFEICPPR
jgi:hypothetical protein